MELAWKLSFKKKLRCLFRSGTVTVIVHGGDGRRTATERFDFVTLSIPRLQYHYYKPVTTGYCTAQLRIFNPIWSYAT